MKTIDRILSAPKGTFQAVSWRSNVKPAAMHKAVLLEKITRAVVKAGIDYANLASVKQGIANGERGEVESLPWGEWKQFPYVITHKGKDYVRLYPAAQSNQVSVTYKANGQEISKESFLSYLTPSDQAKATSGERPACFTVTADNLID
jgi:hypothetical protein